MMIECEVYSPELVDGLDPCDMMKGVEVSDTPVDDRSEVLDVLGNDWDVFVSP